jgi:hypothetical protein
MKGRLSTLDLVEKRGQVSRRAKSAGEPVREEEVACRTKASIVVLAPELWCRRRHVIKTRLERISRIVS